MRNWRILVVFVALGAALTLGTSNPVTGFIERVIGWFGRALPLIVILVICGIFVEITIRGIRDLPPGK